MEVGSTLLLGGDAGDGFGGGGGVRLKEAEYGHAVYCDATDSGHL